MIVEGLRVRVFVGVEAADALAEGVGGAEAVGYSTARPDDSPCRGPAPADALAEGVGGAGGV
jgi:hypothetical protein